MFGNPYTLFVLELCKHCGEPSPSSSQVGTHPFGKNSKTTKCSCAQCAVPVPRKACDFCRRKLRFVQISAQDPNAATLVRRPRRSTLRNVGRAGPKVGALFRQTFQGGSADIEEVYSAHGSVNNGRLGRTQFLK